MSSVYYTALTGLNGYASALDTVANNLANLQTNGFKSSDVEFSDLLGQAMQGAGVGKPASIMRFNQGGIETSQSPLDCAISGTGFFVTMNGKKPQYTRDGRFQLAQDDSGKTILTTSTGNRVQGFAIRSDGTADTTNLIDIALPTRQPATPTSAVQFSGNIDATTGPAGQASFPVTVYDSSGNTHTLSLTFTREASANNWTLHTVVDGVESGTGTALQFDGSGKPINAPANIPVSVNGQSVDLSLMSLTQLASPSNAGQIAQNGHAAADVTGFAIGDDGLVYAHTTDAADVPIAQLALANIPNPETMIDTGNGSFAVTQNTMGYQTLSSSTPATGDYIGDTRTFGSQIVGHAREQSTSDVAAQFGDLIRYQRGYEMTAKAVTTADQMRETLLNIV